MKRPFTMSDADYQRAAQAEAIRESSRRGAELATAGSRVVKGDTMAQEHEQSAAAAPHAQLAAQLGLNIGQVFEIGSHAVAAILRAQAGGSVDETIHGLKVGHAHGDLEFIWHPKP